MWAIGLFLLLFLLGLAMVAAIVVVLPSRYFVADRQFWPGMPRPIRWAGMIGKNLLGLALVILGIVLSIPGVPGPGILTILIGLVLLDFPGKRRLVRLLARRRGVQTTINRLRSWFGRPPMEFETDDAGLT
jgi:hypothetical protein